MYFYNITQRDVPNQYKTTKANNYPTQTIGTSNNFNQYEITQTLSFDKLVAYFPKKEQEIIINILSLTLVSFNIIIFTLITKKLLFTLKTLHTIFTIE